MTCGTVKCPEDFVLPGTTLVPEALIFFLSVLLDHSYQHLWVAQFWGRNQAKIKQEDAETRQ